MSDRTPSDEFLNAYVDGELSPHDRAWVAHAIATDPGIADKVAALARLKSVVAGLGDDRPLSLKDLGPTRSARPRAASGIAASVAAVVLIAGLAAGGYWGWRTTKAAALVAEAKSRHLAWLAEDIAADADGDIARIIRAALRRQRIPAHIPDMGSAKLTLSDVATFEDARAGTPGAMQLRYTGRRGCRVSLWLSHGSSSLATTLTESDDGRSRGFYWRVDTVSYALFATGMDTKRFTLLARNVYEATRDHREPPPQHARELRVATDTAAPCRA
jgi:anti-sigma factor RsiW